MTIKLSELYLRGSSVIEMRLCEAKKLVLKPDQLYYFTVDPNCQECRDEFEHGLTGKHIVREIL